MPTRPNALLLDYGGTLVREDHVDLRAGNEAVLARAAHRPPHATLDAVLERAGRVSDEVASRRDRYQIETPWPALTRLIHDYLGIRFDAPMAELEMAFWRAAVTTSPMPGAREALGALHARGVRLAVVSNCSFAPDVLRYELGKHGLAEHLEFIMVSAEYAVRKPHPLLFETAAARLGLSPREIWFVGDRLDTDVAGARAAGMTPVWFDPANDERPDRPDLAVASWAELVERVERES